VAGFGASAAAAGPIGMSGTDERGAVSLDGRSERERRGAPVRSCAPYSVGHVSVQLSNDPA
jgi:hypothetical protein